MKHVNDNHDKLKTFKVKVTKPISKEPEKLWEDFCFRCMDEGEVLMCDWKTCPKVYHLSCLGRQKMPREKWYCPWHHCVSCGKQAESHCIHCPNAYCKTHNSVLKKHEELGNICDEHKDDISDLVKFYRRTGGIKNLVPNPNVPLSKVRPQTTYPVGILDGTIDKKENNAKRPASTEVGNTTTTG